MIINGSMAHTLCGRRKNAFRATRKPKREFVPLDRAVVPNQHYMEWQEEQRKYKSAGFVRTDMVGKPEDNSYRQEVSKNYTVSIAFNKGAYQVISNEDVKHIGR